MAQEAFRSIIDGEVTDLRSLPIPYVHVLILSRNEGAVGDYEGKFQIAAYPGDTLRLSSVSFKQAYIKIPDTLHESRFRLHVIMVTDTTVLSEFTVYPWPSTYQEFEKEFVDLEMDVQSNPALVFPELAPKELKNIAYPEGGIRFSGPVSLLYEQFGKRPRSLRMRNALQAEDRRRQQVLLRYNPVVISMVTDMKDMEEIRRFQAFCSLLDSFILRATDYELYKAIWECYEKW